MTKNLIDTNILIYSIQREDKNHSQAVATIIEAAQKKEFVISTQNLAEFSWVLLEKITPKSSSEEVTRAVFDFVKFAQVISHSEETVLRAISLSNQYKIHFFDALLVATMQENNIETIVTENTKDFEKIPWLVVVNPLNSKKDK